MTCAFFFPIETREKKTKEKKTLLATIFISSIQDGNGNNPCTRKTDSQSPERRAGRCISQRVRVSVKKREGVKGVKRKEMRATKMERSRSPKDSNGGRERKKDTKRERESTREPETMVQRTRCTRLIIPLSCMLAFTLTSQSLRYPHHRRRRRRRRVVGRTTMVGDRLYARRQRERARRRAVVARSA